jgi:excisionase family DNA binding protein
MSSQCLLTVKQLSEQLGCSICTVYRMAKHEIPSIRLRGRDIRFKQTDVDHWLERKKASPFLDPLVMP